MSKKRRLSRSYDREWIFKICYASAVNKDTVEKNYDLIKDSFKFTLSDFGKLYLEVMNNFLGKPELIEPVKSNLEKIDYTNLSTVARVLLQMGVAEMRYLIDIPGEVSINEIMNLAGMYADYQEKRIINSVLDKVYRYLQETSQINEGFFLK